MHSKSFITGEQASHQDHIILKILSTIQMMEKHRVSSTVLWKNGLPFI